MKLDENTDMKSEIALSILQKIDQLAWTYEALRTQDRVKYRKTIQRLRTENGQLKIINHKAFKAMERICELTNDERIIELTDKPWIKE